MIVAGMVALAGLSWAYLLRLAGQMTSSMAAGDSGPMSMGAAASSALGPISWGTELGFTFVTWAIMMVAMMVPSAAPMALVYGRVYRRQGYARAATSAAASLLAGYLLAWAAFSLVATLWQTALTRAALLSPMMASTSSLLGGGILVAAGAYQMLPFKEACLRRCRAPVQFLLQHWRPGRRGAFRMGMCHGVYCVGCCWLLMALLFVGGVMNLAWIAVISGFVLLERLAPEARVISWLTGSVLVVVGAWVALA